MTHDIIFVRMPFSDVYRPSLGLSLLRSVLLRETSFSVDILYLDLPFAELLGNDAYYRIVASPATRLLGEWIFAASVFGIELVPDETVNSLLSLRHQKDLPTSEELIKARRCVRTYLDDCLQRVDWSKVKVVGFSTTFQQTMASLSLAKLLKHHFPHLRIVFGGANCEGPMGLALLRGFPVLDAVCSGEGEGVITSLITGLVNGQITPIPGVYFRETLGPDTRPSTTCNVADLDTLPYPDYAGFFQQFDSATFSKYHSPDIVFETSRGCWWGSRSHCSFCGLNGSSLQYRSKSPSRVLSEIKYLISLYGQRRRVRAADNIIDPQYFHTLLPRLKECGIQIDLFYETKANLRRHEMAALAEAGCYEIQPGIESLSTHVLKLMRKGVTAIQNVLTLRLAREYGVRPIWNLLYGVPGEQDDDYRAILTAIPALTHLCPPQSCDRIRLDRFSPYFSHPELYGLHAIRPASAYDVVYAGLPKDLRVEIAYYHEFDYPGLESTLERWEDVLQQAVSDWQELEGRDHLLFHRVDDATLVFDGRAAARQRRYALRGVSSRIHDLCDDIRSRNTIISSLPDVPADEIDECLRDLVNCHLLFCEGDRYVRLAVPAI